MKRAATSDVVGGAGGSMTISGATSEELNKITTKIASTTAANEKETMSSMDTLLG